MTITTHWKRRTTRPTGFVKPDPKAQPKGWRSLLRLPFRLPSRAELTSTRGRQGITRLPSLQKLPPELILGVAEELVSVRLADVLNLSLTCSSLRQILLPVLYESVMLDSSSKCQAGLAMFADHPDICAHIRKLAVRPNYYLSWPKPDEAVEEDGLSEKIVSLAPLFKGLDTFDWDGRDLPPGTLWAALRNHCPSLKSIYCNIGLQAFPPKYELFNFTGLEAFVITVGYGLPLTNIPGTLELLPSAFWDMLDRSPDLGELTICSFSTLSRALDFRPITEKRWPKLHSLALGSFGYETDPWLELDNPEFTEFLGSHPSLTFLQLQWDLDRWLAPHRMPWALQSEALPNLKTFVGIYQQLEQLPNPHSIETLDLTCTPMEDSALTVLLPVLRRLTSLTSLDIWVNPPPPSVPGHELYLSRLLGACPRLTDLHLRCTAMTFTRKSVRHLLLALILLPSLKVFSLTKMYKFSEKSMLDHALWVLRHEPNLEEIRIRWAHEKCRNHLKQEGHYLVKRLDNGDRVLSVHEKGIPAYGKPFDKRYKRRLPTPPIAQSVSPPLRRR